MGILIKNGIEMPKEGFIEILICDDGTVQQTGQSYRIDGTDYYTPYAGEMPVMYKAVPVPPHGRLIDADALIADLKRQCREVFRVDAVSPDDFWITRIKAYNERLWGTWCESFFDYLQTRPIIIPASEEET